MLKIPHIITQSQPTFRDSASHIHWFSPTTGNNNGTINRSLPEFNKTYFLKKPHLKIHRIIQQGLRSHVSAFLPFHSTIHPRWAAPSRPKFENITAITRASNTRTRMALPLALSPCSGKVTQSVIFCRFQKA